MSAGLLGALTLAAVVATVVAEAGSRWWIRRRSRYYVWPPGMRLEIQPDSEVFPELESRVRFYVNAAGERGGDIGRGDDRGYRMLTVGGSAVECFALDQPTSWPGTLERLLNTPDRLSAVGARQVHVGNVGHSGVGSAELDLILKRLLPQYGHLDVILIMVAASDVYHWLEDGAPPSRPPQPVPEGLLFACRPGQPFSWKPTGWALVELWRRLRRAWLHPVEVKAGVGAWYASARRMRAEAKEVRSAMPDASVMVQHFERHFRRLVQRATTHADRVVVVRQPWFEGGYSVAEAAHFWHGGVGKAWKETVSVYFDLEVINRLLSLVDARAAAVADELGVAHVNVRPHLSQRLRHYYDHDHFTPAGAAVVADVVARVLIAPAPARRPPALAEPLAISSRTRDHPGVSGAG